MNLYLKWAKMPNLFFLKHFAPPLLEANSTNTELLCVLYPKGLHKGISDFAFLREPVPAGRIR